MAGRMYCEENNGYWPSDKWMFPRGFKNSPGGEITPFLGKLDHNPARIEVEVLGCPTVKAIAAISNNERRTYMINSQARLGSGGNPPRINGSSADNGPVKIFQVRRAADMMFFIDGASSGINVNGFLYDAQYNIGHLVNEFAHIHGRQSEPRGTDFSNVGYVDGHADRLTRAEAQAIHASTEGKKHDFFRGGFQ